MKPNIENIPCFNQVAQVIGRSQARIELFKAVGWKKWFEKNQNEFVKIKKGELDWGVFVEENPARLLLLGGHRRRQKPIHRGEGRVNKESEQGLRKAAIAITCIGLTYFGFEGVEL